MEEEQVPRRYTPSEVAKRLGISTNVLNQMRRNGKIEGIEFKNTTLYTEEQIRKADLRKRRPGPKAGEGSRRGRARYTWPEDEGFNKSSQNDKEASDTTNDFSPQWHISDNKGVSSSNRTFSTTRRLVGV